MPIPAVTQTTCARIPTPEGEFQLCHYANTLDQKEHLALVLGDLQGRENVPVRVHSECFTGDVLGSLRCDCGEQLHKAMAMIAQAGFGAILYLRQEGRGIGLAQKLRAYNLQDAGYDTVDANLALGHQADERDYTVAGLIIQSLGIRSVSLITNNPSKIESLESLGVTISSRLPLVSQIHKDNAVYLETKVKRMRHLLDLDSDPSIQEPRFNGVERSPYPTLDPARATAHRQRTGRPWVTLTYAQSLDGSIARQPGHRLVLSGPESMVMTHHLRATHQAILVGVGALLADDPQLTVRLVTGSSPQPIVLDTHLRTPPTARLLSHPRPPILVAGPHVATERRQALQAAGAQVWILPTNPRGQIDLSALLARLGQAEVDSLMVEGGGQVIASFLQARLVNQLILTVAPVLVGGLTATTGGISPEQLLPRLHRPQRLAMGDDLVIWGDLLWDQA